MSRRFDLKGRGKRVAVITGAASGLGRALTLNLAGRSWKLALSDIDADRLTTVADEARAKGCDVTTTTVDTSEEAQVARYADEVFGDFGRCDLLINNAGVGSGGGVGAVSLDEWRRAIGINLWGPIYGCHYFLPRMREQDSGHIVNVASIAAYAGAPEMGPYNVTKAGVVSLSETLRAEFVGTNFGVTVVCPSFFRTRIHESMPVEPTTAGAAKMAKKLVEGSKVSADTIAEAVLTAVGKDELYVVPQADAKMMWRMRRLMPERFSDTVGKEAMKRKKKVTA